MTGIAERLSQARGARGLSRRALSLRAGLAQAVVGQIERGDVTSPALETVSKLAVALEVSLDWLVTGAGEGPDTPIAKAS